jgi:osmotically inducible lipoprotein OsmB
MTTVATLLHQKKMSFPPDIHQRGITMKTIRQTSIAAVVATVMIALGGCSGMTRQEQGTATGAVIGGVAGNVLGGGLLGTAAGAAVGGVVGHEVTKPKY